MTNIRCLLAVVILCVSTWAGARRADACGATPDAYWTLGDVLPAKGQPIATDGAFLLTGKAWTNVYPDRGSDELSGLVTVTVRDAGGVVVPGIVEPWYTGRQPTVSWRPLAPLPADSVFTVRASVDVAEGRPAEAVGDTVMETDIVTGTAAAAPLQVSGPLQITLETYDQPVWKDCNDCGTGCTVERVVRALRAQITVPAVQGGFAPDGYAAWVWLTNDRPYDGSEWPDALVNLGGIERLESGQPTVVVRDIPGQEQPYAPCFSVRVFAPSGHAVTMTPVCLPRMDVTMTVSDLDGQEQDDERPSGCALVSSARRSGWPSWAILAAFVFLRLSSRGRGRRR